MDGRCVPRQQEQNFEVAGVRFRETALLVQRQGGRETRFRRHAGRVGVYVRHRCRSLAKSGFSNVTCRSGRVRSVSSATATKAVSTSSNRQVIATRAPYRSAQAGATVRAQRERVVVEGRKQAVSIRMTSTDVRKVKRLANRL